MHLPTVSISPAQAAQTVRPPIFGSGLFGAGPFGSVEDNLIDERHTLFFNFGDYVCENRYDRPKRMDYRVGVPFADKGSSQVSTRTSWACGGSSEFSRMCISTRPDWMKGPTSRLTV